MSDRFTDLEQRMVRAWEEQRDAYGVEVDNAEPDDEE